MKSSTRFGMGHTVFSRKLAGVAFLASIGLASQANAEGSAAESDRANLLFKKGKVAFNAGKYGDALRIYSEAWSLKKSPDIAANLAQTETELGKHRAAAEHFAFALAHLLPSSTDEQKAALAEGLELEKKEIGSLHVTLEPADSALVIDDESVPLLPGGEVFVDPGEHRASVTHEGYEPSAQTVRVSRGAAQVLWLKLRPVGAPATPPAETAEHALPPPVEASPPPLDDSSSRSVVPAIVGGGLLVAGAAVGVVFLLSANSSQKDAAGLALKLSGPNPCGAGTPNASVCDSLHQKNSDIDRARKVEVIGFSVAGAAAIGTALYLLWPHSSSTAASHWSPTVAVAPGAGSFGLTGRF